MKISKITSHFIILFIVTSGLVFSNTANESWKIFDDTSVGEVKIIIDPAYLYYLLAPENSDSDSLFSAIFIYKNAVIPGDTVFNIGFRLRGNTSRKSAKKSFKVDINHFVPGRQFYDLEKLNLNGEHNDPSIIRSKLCWDLFNAISIPASRANHVKLFINDEYRGLYINVEHIDDEFVQNHFGNQNGNLFKCLWPADLVFKGSEQELYKQEHNGRRTYDLKTNKIKDDYSDLVYFIDVLNNTTQPIFKQELEKVFNVDHFLKWLAINVLVGSWDDYCYLKNNYYLYHNTATDKFEFIPYDYDNTYGVDWVGGNWGTRDIYNWGHLWEARPLVTQILSIPEYRNSYTQYLSDYLDNEFAFDTQEPRIDQLKTMITPGVEADSFRILDWDFSIEDFHLSYDDSVATVHHHVPYGIKPYIQTRIATAKSQLSYVNLPPIIKQVEHSPLYPEPSQTVNLTAEVNDNDKVNSVRLYYRTSSSSFKSIVMYDDGNHNDGAANDGKYGAQIPAQSNGTIIYYYVEAQDNHYAMSKVPFAAPQNAFHYISRQSSHSDVLIKLHFKRSLKTNEVGVGLLGSFNDWIKIYPMKNTNTNFWEIPFFLPQGSYIYKFVTYQNLDGQSGVTEWIADPKNPERDGPPYYNAVLNVTDPMFYYMKPLNHDTIYTHQPAIHATLTSSRNTTIDPNSIIFKIDEQTIDNAGDYYDATESEFKYNPPSSLLTGKHTIFLSVQNSQGNSIEKSSEFFINSPLLFINEFMASNSTTIVDEFGEDDDWLEIQNSESVSINVNGMFVTDNLNRTQKWILPDTTIQPGGFLLIWADGDTNQGSLHTNFKLSAGGEQLGLFASETMGNFPIDTLSFGSQTTDISYGRYPDGGTEWRFFSTPTPGKSNVIPTNLPPVISNVTRTPLVPSETDIVWVTAQITDDSGLNEVKLKYFTTPTNIHSKQIIDDGQHHDGAANDSVFGGSIPPIPDKTIVYYFIIAQDDSLATTSNPLHAPDSTYSYQVGYGAPPLFINEFMADNQSTIPDENGELEDWIEIYNNSDQHLNLAGKYLSDDLTNPRQWQFPDISIEPHGYLLIWADANQEQGLLHTNFKLGRTGEQIGIFDSDLLGNAPIDTITFEVQYADTSYGRYPDGSDDWDFMPPTPAQSNAPFTQVVISENHVPVKFELWQNYPNPFNPETKIKFALPEPAQVSLKIFNIYGQLITTLVDKKLSAGYHSFYWNGADEFGRIVSSGTYFYQVTTDKFKATRKMVLLR